MADVDTQLPTASVPGSEVDAGTAGVPNGKGMSAGGKVDAGSPGFDPKQFVPVTDLNKLRSTLDQQNSQLRKQLEATQKQLEAIQKATEESKLKGMTADERAAYEIEREQYEAEQAKIEAGKAVQSAEYMRNLFDLKMYYTQKGAPPEIVNITDPAEMQDKFLGWYAEKTARLEKELNELKASAAKPSVTPPQVSVHKPGSGMTAKIKWSTVKVGSPEEEKLFEDLKYRRISTSDIDYTA